MRYEFILNPVAGNGYSLQAMQKVEGILNALGAEYHIHETAYSGQATEIARYLSGSPDITAVIAVGGDGTVTEVAAGLAGGSDFREYAAACIRIRSRGDCFGPLSAPGGQPAQ